MAAAQQKTKAEPVTLYGLRKAQGGYELVSASATDVTVVSKAEPMQFAAMSLLKVIRRMMEGL